MTSQRPSQKQRRLRSALRSLDVDSLGKAARKTAVVRLRVSPDQKESMRAAAEALGISLSQYLLGLHEQVVRRVTK